MFFSLIFLMFFDDFSFSFFFFLFLLFCIHSYKVSIFCIIYLYLRSLLRRCCFRSLDRASRLAQDMGSSGVLRIPHNRIANNTANDTDMTINSPTIRGIFVLRLWDTPPINDLFQFFIFILFCIHPSSSLKKKLFFLFFLSQYHYSLGHSIFLFSVCFLFVWNNTIIQEQYLLTCGCRK